jgi:NADH dehydrogenase
LRPSVIFGPEDQFFNRFAAISKISPFLPLIGAQTKFQPVYVDDVALATVQALTRDVDAGIYELGGPEAASFEELMQRMLTVIKRKRIILSIPFFAARLMAWSFDLLQRASYGILKNRIVTSDQVKSLVSDNIVSGDHRTFSDLGILPTSLDAVLPDYLWCYRPSGQFSAIKDSAKKLGG